MLSQASTLEPFGVYSFLRAVGCEPPPPGPPKDDDERAVVWVWAATFSLLVGLAGLIPMLALPWLHKQPRLLRNMLAATCGMLLANALLHLLPEAYARAAESASPRLAVASVGVWTVVGVVAFMSMEKLMSGTEGDHRTVAYLNVLVNTLDNITHGLALAAAFCFDSRVGILTSFAIIIHELPHEMADYAILVRSGFSWKQAIFWQSLTSTGCLLGTFIGFTLDMSPSAVNVVLPFTAGGFLYIALVSLVPDLLNNELVNEHGNDGKEASEDTNNSPAKTTSSTASALWTALSDAVWLCACVSGGVALVVVATD